MLRLLRDQSFLAALLLIALVFLATLLTPVEFALWAFYLAPIFVVYVWGDPRSLLPTMALVSVLILLGVLPGWGDPLLPVLALNRIFGVIAIWILGYFLQKQKRGNEEMRANEERMRYALESVSDGAWDWNMQTGELYYSERWLRKLGYAPADAPPDISFWESLVHPDDMPRVRQAMADHFAGRTPLYECENRLRTKAGEYRYNLDRGRVVQWDAEGRPLRMVGADTDITERRQQQAALAQLNAELEGRVRERTAELEAALAELQRADQMKEAFLAAISHELRTPLTGVLGVAEALEMQVSGPLNARQLEHVRLLRRSGTRLLEMINSILHYTNLLAGHAAVRQQPCVLAQIGMAAIRKVQAQAQFKLITVDFVVEPPDLMMNADSEALTQLLYNLLDNAVKFTPAGGAVGLQIGRRADAGFVEFAVWDTGIGIAGGEQERIFEAFTQADAGMARRYQGIGLGLAYARRMADLFGGTVELQSALGQGSRFVVTLPAVGVDVGELQAVA